MRKEWHDTSVWPDGRRHPVSPVKRFLLLLSLIFAAAASPAQEQPSQEQPARERSSKEKSTPEPAISKAECDATLNAEVKRLDEAFARSRTAWEDTVKRRFEDREKELTPAQMQAARAAFDRKVMEQSRAHVRTVALPGVYRMMLAVPQYDTSVCANPDEMRALGDQAIVEFLQQLAELLPLIDATVDAAKGTG